MPDAVQELLSDSISKIKNDVIPIPHNDSKTVKKLQSLGT